MRRALIAALTLLIVGRAVPVACGEKLEISERVNLEIPTRTLARFSPDGKSIVYVKRLPDRNYSYFLIGADGKGEKELLKTTVGMDDPFTFCFGSGIFSLKGDRLAVLNTADGKKMRDGGRLLMLVSDLAGKTVKLPCETGQTMGALFGKDESVYFVDGFPLRSDKTKIGCKLKKLAKDGKVSVLAEHKDGFLVAMTMNPDRTMIGAVLARMKADRGRPDMFFWAYDLKKGKSAISGFAHFDDYFYDGGPWVFWGAGGKVLYANGSVAAGRKTPFSLLAFEPFKPEPRPTAEELKQYRSLVGKLGADVFSVREKATKELRKAGSKAAAVVREAVKSKDVEVRSRAEGLLAGMSRGLREMLKGESLMAMCEFAPGKMSLADYRGGGRAYILDVASGKRTAIEQPLLLLDRRGDRGLFLDAKTKKLCVARFKLK